MAELDAKPTVLPDLRRYWQAFSELHGQRSCQWQADPIRVSDIRAWCALEAISDPAERRNVKAVVVMLDRIWIARQRERQGRS